MSVVLIVEDELFIRGMAETLIQGWGHETLAASSVEAALTLLRSPAPIDALFIDIRLKAASQGGYEVANEAIKLRPGMPILYTTGFSAPDEMKTLGVEGAQFLAKPYSPDDLKASVERLFVVPVPPAGNRS